MRFLIGKWTIWGADGSGSWLGVWLAAEEAKKCWNQKILIEQFKATSETFRLFLFWEGLVGFLFAQIAHCVFAE